MGNYLVDTILYQPPTPTKLKQSRIIWIKTATNTRIPAFFIEYEDDEEEKHPFEMATPITILYSHANAEDLGHIYPWCKYLSQRLGVNILAYDYTGYGLAYDQGPPNESQCYADIEAAFNYLRSELRIPARNIVLYGRSLGTGPSTYLAAQTSSSDRDTVGGLILHAPFLSIYRVVLPDAGCTMLGDPFPNVDLFTDIETPTLLVHGLNDSIVPFDHSVTLYDILQPKYRTQPFYAEMGHNSVPSHIRDQFADHLESYLDTHVRRKPSEIIQSSTCAPQHTSSNQKKLLRV
jgi:fermentation-respiration switch protein FrsA (DUF1100 family)